MTPSKSRIRKASADLARQVRHVQVVARELQHLMAQKQSTDCTGSAQPHVELFRTAELQARMASARSSKEVRVTAELQRASELGNWRLAPKAPAARALLAVQDAFPHFAAVVELVIERCALARIAEGDVMSLPPILLTGQPGLGKTAFCAALADALQLPLKRIDVATTTASFALAGSHASWSDSKPGAVWQILQSPTASGLLLLDEIDKPADSRYPPLGPLYGLLEPSTARRFVDECVDLAFDASHLVCIATCNNASCIEAALRSRFIEFEIQPPTPSQQRRVARSVFRGLQKHQRWARAFQAELPETVLDLLIGLTPRQMCRVIEGACGCAALAGRRHILPEDFKSEFLKARPRRFQIGFCPE